MGKKGKKAQAGKPKKLTPKDIGKRLDVLAKTIEEELEGADLFAPLPPTEDCAICFVPVSRVPAETFYQPCCGKFICKACYTENEESIKKQNEKNANKKEKSPIAFTCPFCREPVPTTCVDEENALIQARCLLNDHNAFVLLGDVYRRGLHEMPKDVLKALDCYIQAVELGSALACLKIGHSYRDGNVVGLAVDKERAALFERAGALRGDIHARNNIGYSEYYDFGIHEIGIRHWKIAAEAGEQRSLNALRGIYNRKEPGREFISKEYLDFTYRACHKAQMEVKSEEREKHLDPKSSLENM